MEKVTVREILDYYETVIKKTIKNKNKIARFEMNKMQYIKYVVDVLNGDKPLEHRYNIFLIYEPKPRLIMSLNICDKIVNHYFTTKYLIPKLDKLLDDRNVATRKNKGTDYALNKIKKYIEYYKKNNKNIYILKLDISKFFYTIDHNVLKRMLREDLDIDEYNFTYKIIDSTNYPYINKSILKVIDKHKIDLPLYEYGKGLPIGNLSSQLLSIYYLNRLDHFIVHNLKLCHFIRYMDDIIILNDNKEYLIDSLNIIISKLNNEYKLNINKKKTFIIDIKDNGFIFLGYRFIIYNNKTIMLIRRESIRNMVKKIKHNIYLYNNNLLDFDKYFASMSNYFFSYRSNKLLVKNIIDGYIL